ncbi:MAG: thioesterase family protein [Spirochaetes bacterium]|jgi:acyl-CoA thioester hydrolase|nr:thioesterase family protein [Spirochaetota bacterium]
MIETYRGAVYAWECDHMGHMNVRYYAAKFDEATWQLFARLKITPEYLRKNNRGMAAAEQHTRYVSELLAGDVVEVCSEVIELRAKTIRFRHVMKNSVTGTVAAETEFLGIHIDRLSRKSCEFDGSIIEFFMKESPLHPRIGLKEVNRCHDSKRPS